MKKNLCFRVEFFHLENFVENVDLDDHSMMLI